MYRNFKYFKSVSPYNFDDYSYEIHFRDIVEYLLLCNGDSSIDLRLINVYSILMRRDNGEMLTEFCKRHSLSFHQNKNKRVIHLVTPIHRGCLISKRFACSTSDSIQFADSSNILMEIW